MTSPAIAVPSTPEHSALLVAGQETPLLGPCKWLAPPPPPIPTIINGSKWHLDLNPKSLTLGIKQQLSTIQELHPSCLPIIDSLAHKGAAFIQNQAVPDEVKPKRIQHGKGKKSKYHNILLQGCQFTEYKSSRMPITQQVAIGEVCSFITHASAQSSLIRLF